MKKTFNEPFVFNSFDDVKNDNSIIWEAVKKRASQCYGARVDRTAKSLFGLYFLRWVKSGADS